MSAPKKRGPGRPRLHKETTLVTFRAPVQVATIIKGIIEGIKLIDQGRDTPAPVILIDALRARLKQVGNRNPKLVESMTKSLDRAMTHYEHVERK
jgi:hypothetical protein